MTAPYIPPYLQLGILNPPPLRDQDAHAPRAYVGVSMKDPDAEWRGAWLYRSRDGVTYEQVLPITEEAIMGETQTALGKPDPDYCDSWDYLNSVDVEIWRGTLESKTELEVLNGANRIVIGTEMIAYQDATLIGTRQYRLEKLLRGLKASQVEPDWPTHAAVESVMVLDDKLQIYEYDMALMDVTFYWKAAAVGADLADVDAVQITLTGGTVTPVPVAQVSATRDGANDVTVSWVAVSRGNPRLLLLVDQQLCVCEEDEYEIDLLDPTGTTVESTYEVASGSTSHLITDADVVAAGYGSGDPITVRVYRKSKMRGRGWKREATV